MIVNDIRPVMKREEPHTIDSWDNLYKFYLDRARNNLHVILCFSPVGDKFSTRARKFPGLVSQCNIDIFMPWPEDALRNVSDKYAPAHPLCYIHYDIGCSDAGAYVGACMRGTWDQPSVCACVHCVRGLRTRVYCVHACARVKRRLS